MRFLIFDTETTGLPKSKSIHPDELHLWPYIVQFSYIIYDTEVNNIIKTVDEIIKIPEDIEISEVSSQIHGITKTIINQKGINIKILLKNFFLDLITANIDLLIGHNISFDINMVRVEMNRLFKNNSHNPRTVMMAKSDLEYLNNYKKIYCTLQETIDLCNIKAIDKYGREYVKFPKLLELHEKLFKEKPQLLHNSLNDILITLRCFIKLRFNTDLVVISPHFEKIIKEKRII